MQAKNDKGLKTTEMPRGDLEIDLKIVSADKASGRFSIESAHFGEEISPGTRELQILSARKADIDQAQRLLDVSSYSGYRVQDVQQYPGDENTRIVVAVFQEKPESQRIFKLIGDEIAEFHQS